jgi:hypothetical protein
MKSKVYVVQNQHRQGASGNLEPKYDLRPAEEYGEISFLLSPTARPFRPGPIVSELHTKLKHYRSTHDYLLLLGNPCLIGIVVSIAQEYGGGRVRMLQWDGRNNRYTAIEADLRAA